MEKVLVTGGAGYVGSVLVPRLLERNHPVTVLDTLAFGQTSLLACCSHPRFSFVKGDCRDEALVGKLVKEHDVVIPLAAIVGAPACERDPETAWQVNLGAIRAINRHRSPSQKVVWPCTNSGYGTTSAVLHCDEETPLDPVSVYGKTKALAEFELLDHGNAVSLRLATAFGPSPRMRLDLLVNDFTHRAWRDGYLVLYEAHFKRNYVHVEDVARAFCFALDNFDRMKGRAYNVGLDDANLSKAELAAKVKTYVPKVHIHEAQIGEDPDRRNYIVSNERIRKLGFEARMSLDEGIRQILKVLPMMPRDGFMNA